MQDQVSTQSFEIKITDSDFYIENKDPEASPWFNPGDVLKIAMPTSQSKAPQLTISGSTTGKEDDLIFNTISDTYSCSALSAATLFVTFDVQLEQAPELKWRFEFFSQRFPSKVCYKPNNRDLVARFNFYVLDKRFDPSDNTCGQLQHHGNDGSGGGLVN